MEIARVNVTLSWNKEDSCLILEDHIEKCTRECGVTEAMKLSGKTAGELVEICFPSRSPENEDGSYCLRMTYGESTGVFYRNKIQHEYRVGYNRNGSCELVVSTGGSFPIWPVADSFFSYEDSMDYLIEEREIIEKHDLGL